MPYPRSASSRPTKSFKHSSKVTFFEETRHESSSREKQNLTTGHYNFLPKKRPFIFFFHLLPLFCSSSPFRVSIVQNCDRPFPPFPPTAAIGPPVLLKLKFRLLLAVNGVVPGPDMRRICDICVGDTYFKQKCFHVGLVFSFVWFSLGGMCLSHLKTRPKWTKPRSKLPNGSGTIPIVGHSAELEAHGLLRVTFMVEANVW